MRVVVMGCGRVGARLAKELNADGHAVTVIDQDRDAFSRLDPQLPITTVTGVGFDLGVLERAGVRTADAFAAVSSGDNSNIIAARVAREDFQVPRVVARIYDERRAQVFERLGIPSIATVPWTARRFFDILTEATELPSGWTAPTGEVVIVPLAPSANWAGHTVAEFEEATAGRVSVIQRLGASAIAAGQEILHGDEHLHTAVTTTGVAHAHAVATVGPRAAS